MDDRSLFAAYVALWRQVQADVGRLTYSGMNTDEGGHFQHDGRGAQKLPEVIITRPGYLMPADEPSEFLVNGDRADIKAEFFTLAHEYGHYLSWQGRTARAVWLAYHAALLHRDAVVRNSGWDAVERDLEDTEKQLISDEETLAWKLGRQFTPDELLPEYEEKARKGVHNHRYRLGLDDTWPGD